MNGASAPRVSVIMNCRNAAAYLDEALRSAFQQTLADYEIIFWDNRSTDGSREIAARYAGDVRLRIFHGDRDLPLGAARNEAVARSRGRYLAFLDCDDVWLPPFLERQTALLESNGDCGFVYADAYRVDDRGGILGRFSDDARFLRGRRFRELLAESFVSAFSTVVIRADVLREVGGFRPQFNICEEYDLFLRVAERYAMDYCPEPLVKFRWHGTNTSRNQFGRATEALDILNGWLVDRPALWRLYGPMVRRRLVLLHGILAVENARRGEPWHMARHAAASVANAFLRPDAVATILYRNLHQRRLLRHIRHRLNRALERWGSGLP
jgi:glycosyltransferase involved in cell wall biosynthesis